MLVPHFTLDAAEMAALGTPLNISVSDAVFRVEGTGAIACLQGLLTNDVTHLGTGGAVWGAFLTPKGMIISDAWVIGDGAAAWVVTPARSHDTVKQLFGRTMPPRLAKVTDSSDTMQVRWCTGGKPVAAIDGAIIATPKGPAPFTSLILTDDPATCDAALAAQGWRAATEPSAEALKLVIGWPVLGREIDDKTLPQEVRFDELGGVKYDKGCYTGQETVARLHFRGHANRALRGVRWSRGNGPTDTNIVVGDKSVGTLRTVAQLDGEYLALAIVRREVVPGEALHTGATEGILFEPPYVAEA